MYRATRNTTRALAGLAITGVLGLGGVGLANAASTDDEVVPTLTAVDDSTTDSTDTATDTGDSTTDTSDLPVLGTEDASPGERGGRGGQGGRGGGCEDGGAAPADAPAEAPADAPVTVEEEAPATVAPQPEAEQSVDTGDL